MMYECEMLMKCFLSLENKSLTNVGEFREIKSRTAIGNEEYAPLQTLFGMFLLGVPVLLF